MKLLVVIVSYRVTDFTIDCLRSLSGEIGRVPGTRVAVCENGTGGDAADRLRRAIDENGWSSWVDLTVIHPNRGFTGGNNVVIRPALASSDPPDYVLLLNADTIVQEHALDRLVAFMDANPKVGIAASMEISPDRTSSSSPFRFAGIATELDRGVRLGIVSKLLSPWGGILKRSPQEACRAGWVCTAAGMLRRTMLEQIGLLDEGLYTYFDDIDICLRAQRAGWETWLVPESKIIHFGGRIDGGDRSGVAETNSSLLVSGTAPVLPEEPWRLVYDAGGCGVHPRVCRLAAQAPDSAQGRCRPTEHADGLDPPQRLLHRLQGQRG